MHRLSLTTLVLTLIVTIAEAKDCNPNPCGWGGTCTMVVDVTKDKKTGPHPLREKCYCPKGYSGLDNCRWPCVDVYKSCQNVWKEENRCRTHGQWTRWYDLNCPVTCGVCQFDERTVPKYLPFPPQLEPLETLLGTFVYKSPDHKKFPVHFPWGTTYTETITVQLSEVPMFGTPALNYTSYAVNNLDKNDVMVENGFISVTDRWEKYPVGISIFRVNNVGGAFWEEGHAKGDRKTYDIHLKDVRTTTSELDGFDMLSSYPQNATRTITVGPTWMMSNVKEIRNGVEDNYIITYYKVREQ